MNDPRSSRALASFVVLVMQLAACRDRTERDTEAPIDAASDTMPDDAVWSLSTSGTTADLRAVWAASPGDAWVVGGNGTILHWDGSAWTPSSSGTTESLTGVWGSGPADVWVVGSAEAILHWDGLSWTPWSVTPSGSCGGLVDVWGSGPGDVWAICGGESVVHWDGVSWTATSDLGPACGGSWGYSICGHFLAIWGSGPNDVWASGWFCGVGRASGVRSPYVDHWNGSGWSTSFPDAGPPPTGAASSLWGSGPDDIWAIAGPDPASTTLSFDCVGADAGSTSILSHWNGASWSLAMIPRGESLHRLWGTAATDVWAVGDRGRRLHWDGRAWSDTASATSATIETLWGVGGSGPRDVWAVGTRGTILHRAPP